jgi:hypothetical protein
MAQFKRINDYTEDNAEGLTMGTVLTSEITRTLVLMCQVLKVIVV